MQIPLYAIVKTAMLYPSVKSEYHAVTQSKRDKKDKISKPANSVRKFSIKLINCSLE